MLVLTNPGFIEKPPVWIVRSPIPYSAGCITTDGISTFVLT